MTETNATASTTTKLVPSKMVRLAIKANKSHKKWCETNKEKGGEWNRRKNIDSSNIKEKEKH